MGRVDGVGLGDRGDRLHFSADAQKEFGAIRSGDDGMAAGFAAHPSRLVRYVLIDGLPGFITIERDNVVQTTALAIESGKIIGIYVTRTPTSCNA